MTKWTAACLFAVFALAGPAQAQYYVRPPTNPYFRPQLSPYFTYYYGPGGLGGLGPYVVPPALALGGVRGAYPVGPAGVGTYGSIPSTGIGPGAVAGVEGQSSAEGALSGNQTGHPTRFMAYSQYFLNQGGAAGGVIAGGTAPISGLPAQAGGPTVFGTGSFGRTTPTTAGTRPPRGRENTKPNGGR